MDRVRTGIYAGGAMAGFMAAAALLSLIWTPYDHTVLAVANKFADFGADHWLGTDQLGRDTMTLLMIGARNSIAIALAAVGLGGTIGVLLGLTASAMGGAVEEVIMRLADFCFAFPALLFAIMLAAAFGPSLENAIIAIAFINIPTFTRIARAAAKQVWHRDFVTAARASGRSTVGITIAHILPNMLPFIIVQATIDLAVAILAEAALSYLGLGVQPPEQSWGRLLAEAQTLLYLAPQLAILPGLCITVTVLGFTLLGDALRDLTDPRFRRERR